MNYEKPTEPCHQWFAFGDSDTDFLFSSTNVTIVEVYEDEWLGKKRLLALFPGYEDPELVDALAGRWGPRVPEWRP